MRFQSRPDLWNWFGLFQSFKSVSPLEGNITRDSFIPRFWEHFYLDTALLSTAVCHPLYSRPPCRKVELATKWLCMELSLLRLLPHLAVASKNTSCKWLPKWMPKTNCNLNLNDKYPPCCDNLRKHCVALSKRPSIQYSDRKGLKKHPHSAYRERYKNTALFKLPLKPWKTSNNLHNSLLLQDWRQTASPTWLGLSMRIAQIKAVADVRKSLRARSEDPIASQRPFRQEKRVLGEPCTQLICCISMYRSIYPFTYVRVSIYLKCTVKLIYPIVY